jgi:Phosphotransferase enzyme family
MSVAAWSTPAWLATATAWLDDCLGAAGAARTGPVEQPRLRPWATLLRAPTTRGVVWLKAGGPGTAFEAGLYELLARVVPDHVLRPIAVDSGRGWVLLPDGGPPLGMLLEGEELTGALCDALAQYGEMQRALAPHADAMLELGLQDMRPARLPQRFEEALDVACARGTAEDRAVIARLEDMRGTVARWSQRLDASPLPASVDHNDLHDRNVLPAGASGRFRYYDWGDSVVAHPFASMLLPLSMQSPSAADRVRDAYLAAWRDVAPHAELVETLELACRTAKIARALTWVRATQDQEVDADWARAPLRTLASLLDAS